MSRKLLLSGYLGSTFLLELKVISSHLRTSHSAKNKTEKIKINNFSGPV